ncbi:MAG: protein-L-isoaspartate(D-aspartate) O-methyltransferase [Bacteroidales bacterium]
MIFLAFLAITMESVAQMDPYRAVREKMVQEQIVGRGVRDPAVLEAMRKVPRHLFVEEAVRRYAYADGPLGIGYDQTISQPYIVALMTELIKPGPGDTVLEIGTGSGYQAAVLAEIVKQVYTIEIVPELGRKAANLIAVMGYRNAEVKVGDGYNGWPEHAPFDAIIVTAAPERVPQPLFEQLREGGRMVIPVGRQFGDQELLLIEKRDGKMASKKIIPVRFVPFTRDGGKEDNPN